MGTARIRGSIVIEREEYERFAGRVVLREEHLQLGLVHILHALGHLRGYEIDVSVVLVLDVRQVFVVKTQYLCGYTISRS